jgi:hypothetical protein
LLASRRSRPSAKIHAFLKLTRFIVPHPDPLSRGILFLNTGNFGPCLPGSAHIFGQSFRQPDARQPAGFTPTGPTGRARSVSSGT